MAQVSEARGRGRPAAASREDVIDAGLYRYLRGRRVDVQAIAGELGLGRATIYRWFGSRDQLLGEVIIRATEPVLADCRKGLSGKGGPGLLETFDRFNRALAARVRRAGARGGPAADRLRCRHRPAADRRADHRADSRGG
jgi:AcrR family transcriptional regulator